MDMEHFYRIIEHRHSSIQTNPMSGKIVFSLALCLCVCDLFPILNSLSLSNEPIYCHAMVLLFCRRVFVCVYEWFRTHRIPNTPYQMKAR